MGFQTLLNLKDVLFRITMALALKIKVFIIAIVFSTIQ